jgi:hypothetical protein
MCLDGAVRNVVSRRCSLLNLVLHFALPCTRDVRVHGFWFFPWLESLEASARAKALDKTMALMDQGIMVPEAGGCALYWVWVI